MPLPRAGPIVGVGVGVDAVGMLTAFLLHRTSILKPHHHTFHLATLQYM